MPANGNQHFRPGLIMTGIFTLLTGIVYPVFMTGLAWLLAPEASTGSLLRQGDGIIGSRWLGQEFRHPGYFHGRPSATLPACNGAASGGSNLALTNPAFRLQVEARIRQLRESDPGNRLPIPADLVTASGSGLDPHLSPAAVFYQVARVARVRQVPEGEVAALVRNIEEKPWLGLLGEPRINILELNRQLDGRFGKMPAAGRPAAAKPAVFTGDPWKNGPRAAKMRDNDDK